MSIGFTLKFKKTIENKLNKIQDILIWERLPNQVLIIFIKILHMLILYITYIVYPLLLFGNFRRKIQISKGES